MKRAWVIAGVVCALVALLPASAYAEETIPASVFYPHVSVALIGLAVAAVLLFEVIGVRKIAGGGAIAEKMNFVILAVLCLAASALTEWAVNFSSGVTIAQAQLAREVLVIVAMTLLAAYFFSVKAAMQGYLRAMKAEAPAATDPASTPEPDPESEPDRG